MISASAPDGPGRTTIGDVLGARAARVPVRETVLRTILLTPRVDDAFARTSEVLVGWLNRKIACLEVALAGVGRIKKRTGNFAVDAQLEPNSLRLILEEKQANRPDFVWIVEGRLDTLDQVARIDVRVEVEHPFGQPALQLGAPAFLRDVIAEIGIEDIRSLSTTAWRLDDRDGVSELVALIADPRRELDVVVISEPVVGDPDAFAARLAGVAHVVNLYEEQTWILSSLRTKYHGVYGGAIKVYPPGYEWDGNPRQAAMWLPETVRYMQRQGGSHAFLDTLVRQRFASATARFERLALEIEAPPVAVDGLETGTEDRGTLDFHASRLILPKVDIGDALPAEHSGLGEVQKLRTQLADARSTLAEKETWTAALEAHNRQLETENAALRGADTAFTHLPQDLADLAKSMTEMAAKGIDLIERIASISDELAAAEAERDEAKRRIYALQAQRDGAVDEVPNARLSVPVVPFGDGAAFAELVRARYDGAVVVTPRAQRSFSKGSYTNAGTLIAYLDLIAGEYREYLSGVPGADERLRDRCNTLHVKYGPSVTRTGAGMVDGHSLVWNGKNHAFEHVRVKSTTFDPLRMLAIYFFLDEDTGNIIIAHLPDHLDNASNHT